MWYVIHDDTLAHHGILGQKWGKRNGPPYPLGAGDHSASEKKAGWRKSLDKGGSGSYNKSRGPQESAKNSGGKKLGLTDRQKKAIAIGAAAVAAGLAVYGGYKAHQFIAMNRAPMHGLSLAGESKFDLSKSPYDDSPWDKLSGSDLELLKKYQDEAIDINVELRRKGADGSWKKCEEIYNQLDKDRKENCGQCTLAGIASFYGNPAVAKKDFRKEVHRGFDSHGMSNIIETDGISQQILWDVVPAAKGTRSKVTSAAQIESYIKRQGHMTTGVLAIPRGDDGRRGHMAQWVNISGVPVIKDNQLGIISGVYSYMHGIKQRDMLPSKNHKFSFAKSECFVYTVSKEAFDSSEDLDDFIEYLGRR